MKNNSLLDQMRRLFLYILLSGSLLSASDDLDQLYAKYHSGFLTFDELMIYQVSRFFQPSQVNRGFLTNRPIKCGTHVLKSLAENSHLLSDSAKVVLSAMGIDFNRVIPGFSRPANLDKHYDTGMFRFHYTTNDQDAVNDLDEDENGIPDYIQTMGNVFNEITALDTGLFGFTRPPSDEWYEDNGGNGLYDIYIKQLDAYLYGYTQWESLADHQSGDNEFSQVREKNASTSYLVLQNNYDGFPYSELESIQVTAAHEFFHSIQFGYDGWEATWLLEATATWIEDEIYDDINDNYQYLSEWFAQPHIALNYPSDSHWYGSWIFFRYLSEHIGGFSTIRKIFDESIQNDSRLNDSSIRSIDSALKGLGSSFKNALKSMTVANLLLTSDPSVEELNYEEAENYRDFGITSNYKQSIILQKNEYNYHNSNGSLMQNACHYLDITVAEGPIEVRFNSQSEASFQIAGIVERISGPISIYDIGFNSIIEIPVNTKQFSISVVTDTIEDIDYDYSLVFTPSLPLPSAMSLYQNFPNPFNSTTSFRFFLPTVEPVSLSIFDLGGRWIGNVTIPRLRQGFNDATFKAQNLSSGIYLAKLEGKNNSVTRRIAYIK